MESFLPCASNDRIASIAKPVAQWDKITQTPFQNVPGRKLCFWFLGAQRQRLVRRQNIQSGIKKNSNQTQTDASWTNKIYFQAASMSRSFTINRHQHRRESVVFQKKSKSKSDYPPSPPKTSTKQKSVIAHNTFALGKAGIFSLIHGVHSKLTTAESA